MNIAHVLPYAARFPLLKHNGRYEWVLRLATLQADAGHTVSVYCGESTFAYPGITFHSLRVPSETQVENNISLFHDAFASDVHDIIHSHFDNLHYQVAHETDKPIVVTQHWFPTSQIALAASSYSHPNVHVVPVTHYMQQADQKLGIVCGDVIYHGIDLELFSPKDNDNLTDRNIFVGRIAPHKGLLELVTALSGTKIPLDIIGKINSRDADYWDRVQTHIDGTYIRYLGAMTQAEVADHMKSARSFVFTPSHEEAFGQTIIEAQACGTPVIINNLGANRELLSDGVTGYLVKNKTTLLDAIRAVDKLSRNDCRAYAKSFDVHKMMKQYEQLYAQLL